ncbi:branched-chain amino acid aminotransferase [Aliifodinibius salicampi]|uniref:Branched-chain-amino-acid aminotransferase n=1 Tax=Fodinibius salicampi TaxID=1920655 RepID=A0ABT3Q1H8_9BACT|nr:branched-chain amino acid aminotransferase [Fodinibius salicampi]MCW9713931.1 branched-chain amino acid aminotransferase [Fodinibius salicampi]
MSTDITFDITKVAQSRIDQVDLDDPGFGRLFSDHMLEVSYNEGEWQQPKIKPYGTIEVVPALNVFHYAQSVFEGTKAYYVDDETVNLFRIGQNYERFVQSCKRMCIPPVDREVFLGGIEKLIEIDHRWVPRKEGNVLYIRPFACAFDPVISANPAEEYRFFVITSPVGSYYNKSVKLTTSKRYVRAVKGGVGAAKAAGNYAASFYPARKAQEMGYDQVLWLDAHEHTYIEEVGTMNIFFIIDGVLVTPKLQGTILPGITRDSVLRLANHWEIPVEERRINIEEVIEAGQSGKLEEVFGTGTAAVIAPVEEIHHDGISVIPKEKDRGPVGQKLYDTIYDIQRSRIEDPFNWVRSVQVGNS